MESSAALSLLKCHLLNVPAPPSLMTSAALKPHLSDLDNMFDSEDEGGDERLNVVVSSSAHQVVSGSTTCQANHMTPGAPSGGMSMASAHAVGPVSKFPLDQVSQTLDMELNVLAYMYYALCIGLYVLCSMYYTMYTLHYVYPAHVLET